MEEDLELALRVLAREFHAGGISGDRALAIAAIRRCVLRLRGETRVVSKTNWRRMLGTRFSITSLDDDPETVIIQMSWPVAVAVLLVLVLVASIVVRWIGGLQ